MYALGDGAAGGRDYLVVVLDFLALIHERGHGLLATLIYEDGSDLEESLGMEILLGIGDVEGGVDVAGDNLKYGRVACNHYVVCQLGHLLGGGAGGCGDREDGHSQDLDCFFHKI